MRTLSGNPPQFFASITLSGSLDSPFDASWLPDCAPDAPNYIIGLPAQSVILSLRPRLSRFDPVQRRDIIRQGIRNVKGVEYTFFENFFRISPYVGGKAAFVRRNRPDIDIACPSEGACASHRQANNPRLCRAGSAPDNHP